MNPYEPNPPKYKDKYRIESTRLRGWDYRNPGGYFVTICTEGGQYFFGECKNGQIRLSTAGAIVQGFWYEIPKHFPHVHLGEFIVMPNHIHGILILGEMRDRRNDDRNPCRDEALPRLYRDNNNDTNNNPKSEFFRRISPKPGSVSVIIGSFKSICKKHICKTFPDMDFKWQSRFHDHIIRNNKSYLRIANYIVNNPLKWKEDRFYNNSHDKP